MKRAITSLALLFGWIAASPAWAQTPGDDDSDLIRKLLSPSVMVFLVPITAIIVGGAIAITHAMIRHRERLAMIQQGIHPDSPEARGSHDSNQARNE